MQQSTGGAWVTLAEAAASLGCSVDTVRRRVRTGALHAEQRQTGRGPVWYVELAPWAGLLSMNGSAAQQGALHAEQAAEHAQQRAEQPLENPAALELVRLIRDQQQQILELAGRVGFLQSQVQQRDELIRALQAPQGIAANVADSAQEGPQAAPPPEVVSQDVAVPTPRRPWWRFWTW
jgi:hypothetical protein